MKSKMQPFEKNRTASGKWTEKFLSLHTQAYTEKHFDNHDPNESTEQSLHGLPFPHNDDGWHVHVQPIPPGVGFSRANHHTIRLPKRPDFS